MSVTATAPAPFEGFEEMPLAGRWRAGAGEDTRADTDPWSGETLLEIKQCNRDDLDDAFAAAGDAQREWAESPPAIRAAVFQRAAGIVDRRRDEISGWLVHESGGTVAKAELECDLVRSVMWEAASMPHHVEGTILSSDIPGKENRVYRDPVGVVAVISPWNFPLQLSNRSVAPALAVGNAVVLKPASDTPVTGGLLLARILEEAGLPDGLLSVLVGLGSDIGERLVGHPSARVVSFTGSSEVGAGIVRSAGIKKLSLELGGNGPIVVLDDADLDRALDAAVFGSFFHQGQICMIANRLIVDGRVHDEFVERLVKRTEALVLGDPSDPDSDLGPIINASQLETIQDKLRRAREQGAEQLTGGDPTGPSGLGLPPHVLLGSNEVATAHEEVFGPVITVIRSEGEDHALNLANDTEYGLSSAVFTRDGERGVRFARKIRAGMTHVNDSPVNDDANTAFGGEAASGIGRFGGRWAIDEFTTEHWVSVQHTPRGYPI